MCGYTYVLPDNVHSNLTSTSPWPFVQIPCWNPWAFAQIQCKPPRHLGEKIWARSVWNPCIFEVPKWSKWIQMGWERHGNLYVSWCFMMLPLLKFHSHRQPWMKLWANWKQTLSVGTSYTKTHGSVVFRLPAWIAKAWLIFEWCHGWICLSPKVASQWSWKAVYHSTSFSVILYISIPTTSQKDALKWPSGWWFGTFFIFPYIGDNHPNWLTFFRGVETSNHIMSNLLACRHVFGNQECCSWKWDVDS
jgi:hypothetical protein